MRALGFSFLLRAALLVVTSSLAMHAGAQTPTILAVFDGTNGKWPDAPLIQSTDGNFYGTTMSGSPYGGGNVFSMTPAGALTSLYDFCMQPGCSDGYYPGSGVILGSDGNFYGTTPGGGNSYSQGTIFKLTQSGKLTTLYAFCSLSGCSDGTAVVTGLTEANQTSDRPDPPRFALTAKVLLFEITPAGKYRVLYSFCSQQNCADGSEPGMLIQAINGNFYGNGYTGGSHGYGAVYEFTAAGSHKVLYNFCSRKGCSDGANPILLLQDSAGNFYGTTNGGGSAQGYGTVFKITSKNQYVVLHTFELSGGAFPTSLILANDGSLYGTTVSGGSGGGGTIFQTSPLACSHHSTVSAAVRIVLRALRASPRH